MLVACCPKCVLVGGRKRNRGVRHARVLQPSADDDADSGDLPIVYCRRRQCRNRQLRARWPGLHARAVIPKAIPAKISLPLRATGRIPAVVIAHAGSGLTAEGPEPDYVAALNAAGIGALTIDMWTARGVPSGPAAFGGNGGDDRRPPSVRATLPGAFGAPKHLRQH